MNANPILSNALDTYYCDIQMDHKGDISTLLNQVEACNDYVKNNAVTVGWLKSHYDIILPAIKSHRQWLKHLIEDAKNNSDEKKLAELRSENNNLQPYFALLQPFQKFFP